MPEKKVSTKQNSQEIDDCKNYTKTKEEVENIIQTTQNDIITKTQNDIFKATNFDALKSIWLDAFEKGRKKLEKERNKVIKRRKEILEQRRNGKAKKERLPSIPLSDEEYAKNFVKNYYIGYVSRPSNWNHKNSDALVKELLDNQKPKPTKSDKLIDDLIEDLLDLSNTDGTKDSIKNIRVSHRVSMNMENIIGSILEDYIYENVRHCGWLSCWGCCVKAVDFCYTKKGKRLQLLQIKNKSNTENSSSSGIRLGTRITKWHRMNDKSGNTEKNWNKLNEIINKNIDKKDQVYLSEEDFKQHARKIVKDNKDYLYKKMHDLQELKEIVEKDCSNMERPQS